MCGTCGGPEPPAVARALDTGAVAGTVGHSRRRGGPRPRGHPRYGRPGADPHTRLFARGLR